MTSEIKSNGVPEQEKAWHALNAEEVLKNLKVKDQGLSTEEARSRQAAYGLNQLVEAPRPGLLHMLWEQINSFVVWLLIIASIISALLGDYVEAAAIMAIVVLNSVLGIIQERRAEEALAALKKLAAPEAQVMRDGHRTSVPARELVPGDRVFLEAGNFIPADVRLLEAVNLRVEEASLTGESLPAEKIPRTIREENLTEGDQLNMAFMGTLVVVNRIVFLSGGIAHAAYGGIGLAFFMGWPYTAGAAGFSLAAPDALATDWTVTSKYFNASPLGSISISSIFRISPIATVGVDTRTVVLKSLMILT